MNAPLSGTRAPLLLLLVAGFAGPALAATRNVPQDFQTIQAAVNAANPGDVIVIAKGLYVENVTVTAKTDLRIRGKGGKGSVRIDGDGDPCLVIDQSSGIRIEKLTFEDGDELRAVGVDDSSDVEIVKCSVRASDGAGIDVVGGSNVRVRDNRIEDVTGAGVLLEADHSLVAGNRIDVGGPGVVVFGDLNAVEDNVIENAGVAGVSVGSETFATFSNMIADNVIGGGVLAGEGVLADTATGLLVIDNSVRTPDFAGVYLLECTDSFVLGNVINGSGLSGVELDFGCVGVFVRKNKITAAGVHGIFLHNASDENVLRDNVIRMSFDDGVLLDDANGNVLVGNKATLSGGFDFDDQGADNVLIDNVFPNVAP